MPNYGFICNKCEEIIIPEVFSIEIDAAINVYNEALSPSEVKQILDRLNVSPEDFAETIGVGLKVVNRWIRGTQRVSRHFGYFLRALDENPEMFLWLKNKSWRKK